MSAPTTAMTHDSFDGVATPAARRHRSRELLRLRPSSRLHGIGRLVGAAIVTPFAVLMLSALLLALISKLLIEWVAAGFES